MGDTSIQWTDKTWNPVTGCSKVSQGCKNCYAERIWPRVYGKRPFTDVQLHEDRLLQPLSWKKPCRVFVNSMSDLFHENLDKDAIDQVFAVMLACPQHVFQVLTKRAQRMRDYIVDTNADHLGLYYTTIFEVLERPEPSMPQGWPLPNVWLGVSVEDQQTADERIPLLLQTPSAVRWISAEPLIAPINLANVEKLQTRCPVNSLTGLNKWNGQFMPHLDWVVIGGESGPASKVRVFDLRWAYDLIAQCKAAGVPVFMKQLGARPVMGEAEWRATSDCEKFGTPGLLLSATKDRLSPAGTVTLAFRDSHGGDMEEWPEDLRIREFPQSAIREGVTE